MHGPEPVVLAGCLLLAALVLSVAPARASLPDLSRTAESGLTSPWSVSFPIETIAVEGLIHAEPDLLVAESLLVAGRTYGESELRAAVDRVRRLPFVRDAEFSLRRGSRRGLYELVITVEETRRFFFGSDLRFTDLSRAGFVDRFVVAGESIDDGSDLVLLAGMRLFVGRYGTAFLTVEDDQMVAGYTRNRVFGRTASLRVGVEQSLGTCCRSRFYGAAVDPTFARWSLTDPRGASAAVTLPLGTADSVGVEFEHRQSDQGFREPSPTRTGFLFFDYLSYDDLRDDRVALTFFRDTTDDPVFARRGLRLITAITYQRLRADLDSGLTIEGFGEFDGEAKLESRSWRASGVASRWWSVGSRNTVWGTVSAAVASTEIEQLPLPIEARDDFGFPTVTYEVVDGSYESSELALAVGHRIRFGDARGANRELYWETTVQVAREESRLTGFDRVFDQVDASTGIVWRTSWGLFRFGFRYIEISETR